MKDREDLTSPVFTLPELIVNISQHLSSEDLFNFSQCCTLFYTTLQQERIIRLNEAPKKNLRQHNCDIRAISLDEAAKGMTVWENIIVMFSDFNIKVWDMHKNAFLWGGTAKKHSFYKVWISDEKLICYRNPILSEIDNGELLQIVDIKTGNLLSTIKLREMFDNNRVIAKRQFRFEISGNEIIARISNGEIACWDLSGKKIKSYQSHIPESNVYDCDLIVNSNYIVDCKDKHITIINRKNYKTVTLQIGPPVTASTTKDNFLFCALHKNIIVIDMEQGIITHNYKLPIESIRAFYGKIASLIVTDHLIISYHTSGSLIAIDRSNGDTKNFAFQLSRSRFHFKDEFLFIRSRDGQFSELCIWDVSSFKDMKRICTLRLPGKLNKALWHDSKLLLLNEQPDHSSLTISNYKVLHQNGPIVINKINSNNEAPQVDMDEEKANYSYCRIM